MCNNIILVKSLNETHQQSISRPTLHKGVILGLTDSESFDIDQISVEVLKISGQA
jgi:hypothetical protein